MVKFINKKEFAKRVLNADIKILMVYMTVLNINTIKINIYLFWASQIGLLKINKVSITDSTKYSYHINVFLSKLAAKLPEYTSINNDAIKLKNGR